MSTYVLVVESSNEMRKSIVGALEEFGISNIVEANDAPEGINLFKKGQFDFVLTDWNLPEGKGPQFVQDIRQTNKNVPIIVTSTKTDTKDMQQASQAGATGFIVKPFSNDELRETLDQYMTATTG